MRASEIMNSFFVKVSAEDSLRNIAVVMRDEEVGCVCVCDETGVPVGIITDRDIVVRGCARDSSEPEPTAREIMTAEPLTCRLDTDMTKIDALMKKQGVSRIVVVNELGHLAGMITLAEIWHHESPMAAGALSRLVTSRHLRARPTGGHFAVGARSA